MLKRSSNGPPCLIVVGICALAACGGDGHVPITAPAQAAPAQATLLVAPFIEGQSFCDEAFTNPAIKNEDDAAAYCASRGQTGARRVSALLDAIGPAVNKTGTYRLGYTFNLPVFRFFRRVGMEWVFDHDYLAASLKQIEEIDRPVVILLSADHFAVSNDALTADLISNPRNLMSSRDGPMVPTDYFSNPIVAWTLADQGAQVDVMRTAAFKAIRDGICKLPPTSQARIAAVSVLGETHQMFPNLEGGPRFDIAMHQSSDYAAVSVQGFRVWLSQRYNGIDHLNRDLASNFTSFAAVNPPSRDIHTELLPGFFDHIDASAGGTMAVYGWVNDRLGRGPKVQVYLDGKFVSDARTGLSRTDVTTAVPTIADPNIGFHLNLNFREIPHGFHRLDVLVNLGAGTSLLLATRSFLIGDRVQGPAPETPYSPLAMRPLSEEPDLSGGLDGPVPLTSVYYNPMADLWLQFRNQVVRNYVTRYAELMQPSCIPSSKIFSHQLAPTLYGGWNADLLAADASQMPNPAYNQGTTLYGGTAFGAAFFEMKNKLGWPRYSVGEMHPLVALTQAQYLSMFEAHRTSGAVFVAPYYMSTRRDQPLGGTLADFLISPNNRANASDLYYRAIQGLMTR